MTSQSSSPPLPASSLDDDELKPSASDFEAMTCVQRPFFNAALDFSDDGEGRTAILDPSSLSDLSKALEPVAPEPTSTERSVERLLAASPPPATESDATTVPVQAGSVWRSILVVLGLSMTGVAVGLVALGVADTNNPIASLISDRESETSGESQASPPAAARSGIAPSATSGAPTAKPHVSEGTADASRLISSSPEKAAQALSLGALEEALGRYRFLLQQAPDNQAYKVIVARLQERIGENSD